MYTPETPRFTIQKWGLEGSKLHRLVDVAQLALTIFPVATIFRCTAIRGTSLY